MKTFHSLTLMFMLAIIAGVTVTSCGKDHEEEKMEVIDPKNPNGPNDPDNSNDSDPNNTNTTEVTNDMIIGSWLYDEGQTCKALLFREDGTYIGAELESATYKVLDYVEGTYSFDTEKMELKLISEGKTDCYTVTKLTSDKLCFGGMTFEASPLSEKDLKSGGTDNTDPPVTPDEPDEPDDTPAAVKSADAGVVSDKWDGGGYSDDPYLIQSAADLRKLAKDVNNGTTYEGKYFKMTKDITFNRNVLKKNGELNGYGRGLEEWTPIGVVLYNEAKSFDGSFDGNGHSISGIYVDNDKNSYVGFFGFVKGTIKNLIIRDSYLFSRIGGYNVYFGAFVGFISGHISDCISYSTVDNENGGYVGGICGSSKNPIERCANLGKTTRSNENHYYSNVAGIVPNGECRSCVNRSNVTGKVAAGINFFDPTSNCINTGIIRGGDSASGITYQTEMFGYETPISNCVNIGNVSSDGGKYTMAAVSYRSEVGGKNTIGENCYWLENSCQNGFMAKDGFTSYCFTLTNCNSKTPTQLKSSTFLDELNTNARKLGKEYSFWKFGKDGYPTLEFIDE